MQDNTRRKSSVSSRWIAFLYCTVLVAGLLLNAVYYFRLAELRNLQATLNSKLERGNSNADELTLLESQFKKYESEYQLMEHGLKQLYATQCTGLDDFIPVFDDQLVTCRPERAKAFQISGCLIHVPKREGIRLKIEAVKTTFATTIKSHADEETLRSKSFPLEPESNYFVDIQKPVDSDKLQVKMSGVDCYYESEQLRRLRYGVENDAFDLASNEGVDHIKLTKPVFSSSSLFKRASETIEFPCGKISFHRNLDLSKERTVLSPNQYSANPGSDRATYWFGTVVLQPERNGLGGPARRDALLVRLSLESDGPFTSLPDDLLVVRKLLKDFEAGVDPQVVFHPDGWYEFKE